MKLARLAVILAAVASCHYAAPDLVYVPDNPGYVEDVHPLFMDHCLVCHSQPPDHGAPSTFRLDVYDETGGIPGAHIYGSLALSDIEQKRMPPAAQADPAEGVGPNGELMLYLWVNSGAPLNRP
ncbi:MAG: hypothetical protein ABSB49_16060 [Polyangia bacterium]|jgi:hypothetical protein